MKTKKTPGRNRKPAKPRKAKKTRKPTRKEKAQRRANHAAVGTALETVARRVADPPPPGEWNKWRKTDKSQPGTNSLAGRLLREELAAINGHVADRVRQGGNAGDELMAALGFGGGDIGGVAIGRPVPGRVGDMVLAEQAERSRLAEEHRLAAPSSRPALDVPLPVGVAGDVERGDFRSLIERETEADTTTDFRSLLERKADEIREGTKQFGYAAQSNPGIDLDE